MEKQKEKYTLYTEQAVKLGLRPQIDESISTKPCQGLITVSIIVTSASLSTA